MNGFGGFVEDSEFNMFKGVTFNVASFYYAPGWGQIADPKYTYQNGAFVVSLPELLPISGKLRCMWNWIR